MPLGGQVCWTLSKTAVGYKRAPIYKMEKSPATEPVLPADTILCKGLSHKCQASVLILILEIKEKILIKIFSYLHGRTSHFLCLC